MVCCLTMLYYVLMISVCLLLKETWLSCLLSYLATSQFSFGSWYRLIVPYSAILAVLWPMAESCLYCHLLIFMVLYVTKYISVACQNYVFLWSCVRKHPAILNLPVFGASTKAICSRTWSRLEKVECRSSMWVSGSRWPTKIWSCCTMIWTNHDTL